MIFFSICCAINFNFKLIYISHKFIELHKLTLCYSINGKNYGFVQSVEKTAYKAYISINYVGYQPKFVINLFQSNYI